MLSNIMSTLYKCECMTKKALFQVACSDSGYCRTLMRGILRNEKA